MQVHLHASAHLHLLLCHSPITAGLEENGKDIMHRNLCWRVFKVVEPLHKVDPTLLAEEARFQWYRESSQLEIFFAAGGGHNIFCAQSHPNILLVCCWITFLDIASSWWFPLPSLLEQSLHINSGEQGPGWMACQGYQALSAQVRLLLL